MPSSSTKSSNPATKNDAISTAATSLRRARTIAHYSVIPFRRDAAGTIVPGSVREMPNAEIAWRSARATAAETGHVGAVELRTGVLLASFGEVDLGALPH